MDAPDAWLVELNNSPHDLDNIRLPEVEGRVVSAEYKLSSLLITFKVM